MKLKKMTKKDIRNYVKSLEIENKSLNSRLNESLRKGNIKNIIINTNRDKIKNQSKEITILSENKSRVNISNRIVKEQIDTIEELVGVANKKDHNISILRKECESIEQKYNESVLDCIDRECKSSMEIIRIKKHLDNVKKLCIEKDGIIGFLESKIEMRIK